MSNFFNQTPTHVPYSTKHDTERAQGGFLHGFDFINPETQKARGIVLLHEKESRVNDSLGWQVPQHLPFASGTQFSDGSFNFPVFGRPCPTVPRHGFVDSIVCKDASALNALSTETYNVEDGAEILVTKPVDCSFNAIATGGVITIGGGNDGATSGKGVRYFYLADDPIGKAIQIEKHQDVLLEGEVPFYEIVISKKGVVSLVQVRSAPGMPPSKNYIPTAMKVQNIVKAGGDLLEWETTVKSLDPATTIIDHTGGSLASHFSIHAIINGVTIFTQDCPSVGDDIEPNADATGITDEERAKFTKSFKIGFASTPEMIKRHPYFGMNKKNITAANQSFYFMQNVLTTALSALHNYSAINTHRDYAMLGSILGMFARTCFGVSSGESRFKRDHTAGLEKTKPEVYQWLHGLSGNRHTVYTKLMQDTTAEAISNIVPIYRVFKEMKWGGSFGGKAWVNCTKSAIDLYNDCLEGNIEGAVEKFNVVIHTCHNGGLYLNKIQESNSMFDNAAQDASKFALKHLQHISALLDDYAAIEADPSLWEDDMELFKTIDIVSTNAIGKISVNGELPDTLDGKTALKLATEIHMSICGSCSVTHGFKVNIGGEWYKADSQNVQYHSKEKQMAAYKGDGHGWQLLTKIPYWCGTASSPKLFSMATLNKSTFTKM